MTSAIRILFGDAVLSAELNDSTTAQAIADASPIDASVNRWAMSSTSRSWRNKTSLTMRDFKGGPLTSDGGLVLLRKVGRHTNPSGESTKPFPILGIGLHRLVSNRIFGIAAENEDGNDNLLMGGDKQLNRFQIRLGNTTDSTTSDESRGRLRK